MRGIILLLLTGMAITAASQVSIIPLPVKTTLQKGTFIINKTTTIVFSDEGEQHAAEFFNNYLRQYYGFSLPFGNSASSNFIRLSTRKFIQAPKSTERYTLDVTPHSVTIEGDGYAGTFYGMQSLIQLLPVTKTSSLVIPAVTIDDYPAFSYRGLHLDVGRHFFPVEYIKKYIDYIALHKMNTFHWHLTEDQGWRIEIKKYPELTSTGAWRNGTIIGHYPGKGNDNKKYGGYYTQEAIKEVVDYAAARYINVIPEIEMPGHSSAAIAAYPWLSCFPDEPTKIPASMISEAGKSVKGKLVQETWGVFDDIFCAGNDSVFLFLQEVIDEVLSLFPSRYIHVGGDESPTKNWKRCPKCQQRMKDNNLKDEHALQGYFIQRMEKYINSKGRTLIGWDEILEGGLAPNAIVMSWRGERGGIEAAKQDHDVIMTPGTHVYFDHAQTKIKDSLTFGGFTSLQKTYSYQPIPKVLTAQQAKHVLGAQGNVWTEYMNNTRKIEYMIFPRLTALSEVLWSPKEKRNLITFEKRLQLQVRRYRLWGTNYFKL